MSYRELYEPFLEFQTSEDPDTEWFPCLAICHEDHRPSAGVRATDGAYHCFTCDRWMSPKEVIQQFRPELADEAAQEYIEDFLRVRPELIIKENTFKNHLAPPTKHWEGLVAKALTQLDRNHYVVRAYLESRNLRFETLQQLGIGFLTKEDTHWKRDSLVFPYYFNGRLTGLRYRDAGANKSGEPGCTLQLWGVDELQEDPTGVAIIVEGETDRVATYQALGGKYPVVAAPTAVMRREWAREFDGKELVLGLFQTDAAAEKMEGPCLKWVDNFHTVPLRWRPRQRGKDVADWIRYNGEEKLQQLIEATVRRKGKRIMTGREFVEKANTPLDWLIEGLLCRGQIAALGGPQKSYKTWMLLELCRSLISGDSLADIPWAKPIPNFTGNILIVEEEGSIQALYHRLKEVMNGVDWEDRLYFAHQMGIRLDTDTSINHLDEFMTKNNIEFVLFDPMQRLHMVDEDKAAEMGQVWNRVARLQASHPRCSFVIVHHFTKAGCIADGWNAFRGSGRTGGEVDTAFLMEKRPNKEDPGARISFLGRDIPDHREVTGTAYFTLHFTEAHRLIYVSPDNTLPTDTLLEVMKKRLSWDLQEAANAYGVSIPTIRAWVKHEFKDYLVIRSEKGEAPKLFYEE